MFEKIKEGVRQRMRSFLHIEPAQSYSLTVNELVDFRTNAFLNNLWYRGDSYELEQIYKQVPYQNNSFWGSTPTQGIEIRKIHTGLPETIVNTLTSIIIDDINTIKLDNEAKQEVWKQIEKENNFKDLIEDAINKTLVVGDGAFKISLDSDMSENPIIEFFSADRIRVVRRRGRVSAIVFITKYVYKNKSYTLEEEYGYGYINYSLFSGDKEVPLTTIPDTKELKDITFPKELMMAELLYFYKSDKYEGRGKSIYDAKRDNFDALDEAWSQWIDALRAGRTKTYIPESLIPRDKNTGKLLKPNAFDNRFIKIEDSVNENGQDKIDVEQPIIPHDSYLTTYANALDLCLQGIISPSTLGIDGNKIKDDTATAQLGREKVTMYTRGKVIDALQEVLPRMISKVFQVINVKNNEPIEDIVVDVPFGEYNSPAFDAVVDTVSKAKTGGVMSIDTCVEELYGDSKDETWKKEEVARLKAEQGITEVEEPTLGSDVIATE